MTDKHTGNLLDKIAEKKQPDARAAIEEVWNNLQEEGRVPQKVGGGEENFEDFRKRMLAEGHRGSKELLIKEVAELLGLEDWDDFYENFISLDIRVLQRIQKHIKEIEGAADLIAKTETRLVAHLYFKFKDEEIALALQNEKELDKLIGGSCYEPSNPKYEGEDDVGGN